MKSCISQAPNPCGFGFFIQGEVNIKLVTFFIDGFNVYHAIDDNPAFHKYKWLNYAKLAKCFLPPKSTINKIYYFTTFALWDSDKVNRHKKYIRALRNEGIEVVHGKFKIRDRKCRKCGAYYTSYEEKKTDVNIAIKLFQDAMNDEYDTAIIISGDSDLIPSIEAIKSSFPSKEIGIVIPINRRAEYLKNIVDFHMKMKEKHLASSVFEDTITLVDGQTITKPPTWA